MKRLIYADNAATTKLDVDAFEAMKPYMLEEYGNASQPYFFSSSVKKALNESREVIAECIGANPDEIYFTSGGTESNNWALKGFVLANAKRSHIITSEIEHHAILNSCLKIEKLGHSLSCLPVAVDGIISPETLREKLIGDTTLVSVMLANNEIGTIMPIRQLSDEAHASGALFHTDAVQALGHIEVDVGDLGIDMLSASAHKFNGPKGIGFLYLKKGTNISSYADGGAQEQGFRAGTENVAAIVGMAVALRKNCQDIEINKEKLISLETILMNELKGLDFKRNGAEYHIPGNVSLSFKDADGEMLLHRLDLKGICISTGAACDNTNTQVSHVLKAIHLDESYVGGTIRISLGRDNTEQDMYEIAKAINQILK